MAYIQFHFIKDEEMTKNLKHWTKYEQDLFTKKTCDLINGCPLLVVEYFSLKKWPI
jgi:hypothetical protein